MEAIIVLSHDFTERKQIEEELRNSERLLRTISENYPNSYLSVIEKDFSIGYTAGREFSKLGLDPESYIGMSIDQVFGDQADIIREHYERTFAGDEQSFELFINSQHQQYRTVSLYSENGKISRILVVVENITDRVEAERQIRESEERYRMLFEHSSDAIFLVDLKTGSYLDANIAAERLTGRSAAELKKLTTHDVTPINAQNRLDTVSVKKEAQKFGEVLFTRPDGSSRTALLSVVPLDEKTIFGLAHDITERRAAELAVQKANEQLHAQLAEIKELQVALREEATRDPLTGLFNRRYMRRNTLAGACKGR